ncbi:universal stress protein [Streptomyces capitiformicae]|uniref:universal stress protein n=1 Tax=Streptomyces capitiformicae TaxID=2014920 RepID=UPI003570994B
MSTDPTRPWPRCAGPCGRPTPSRADVVAVHAWEPTGAALAPYAPVSTHSSAAEERLRAARLLAGVVRRALGSHIDTAVRAVVVEGPPARVLLKHARGAQLLALGRTDRHEYGLPAIGAVARDCLRHAAVPVVTVPVPERHAAPRVLGVHQHRGRLHDAAQRLLQLQLPTDRQHRLQQTVHTITRPPRRVQTRPQLLQQLIQPQLRQPYTSLPGPLHACHRWPSTFPTASRQPPFPQLS